MPLILALLLLPLLPAVPVAAAPPSAEATQVVVSPARTSYYVASIRLRIDPMQRSEESFAGAYSVSVVPFLFLSESGTLQVALPAGEMDRLVRGETVQFAGKAVNKAGDPREVRGTATPNGERSGRLKVSVFAHDVELVFHTSYELRLE